MENETLKAGLEVFVSAISAVKGLIGLASSAKNIEMKHQALEAFEKVSDARQRYIELQDKYISVMQENQKLRVNAEKAYAVIFHSGACWRQYEVEGIAGPLDNPDEKFLETREDGPFCPSCWTGDDKLHRAQILKVEGGLVHYGCSRHGAPYYFRVPEDKVEGVNLSSYRSRGATKSRSSEPWAWG